MVFLAFSSSRKYLFLSHSFYIYDEVKHWYLDFVPILLNNIRLFTYTAFFTVTKVKELNLSLPLPSVWKFPFDVHHDFGTCLVK